MSLRTRILTWKYLAVAAALAAGGVFLVAFTLTNILSSYESAKAFVDGFVPDGDASEFTRAIYEGAAVRMRIAGAVLLALGCAMPFLRKRAVTVFESAIDYAGSARRAAGRWFAAQPTLHLVALGAIVLVGTAVRLYYVFEQTVRNDEAITAIDHTTRSFIVIAAGYFNPNNQILHTFLTRVAYLLLGFEPWVLRLPAFIAGVAMIPAVYFVFRRLYTSGAGLLAAALTASSSILIFYSSSARGYTMMIVFFLLALHLAARLKDVSSPGGWFLFVVASVLGLYTIPLMLYPLGMIFIWYGLSALIESKPEERWPALRVAIASGVVIGLTTFIVYVPSFLATDILGAVQSNTAYKAGLVEEPDRMKAVAWLWDRWNDGVPAPLVALIAGGFLVSLAAHWKMSRDRVPFVITFFVWILPLFFVQPFAPPHRFYLFLLPIYLGLSGAGLAWLADLAERRAAVLRERLTPALALVLCGVITGTVVHSDSVFTTPDGWRMWNVREVSLWLKDNLHSGDRVFSSFYFGASPQFEYFFDLEGMPREFAVDTWNRSDLVTDRTEHIVIVVHERSRPLERILREGAVSRSPFVDSLQVVRGHVPREGFGDPVLAASFDDPYDTMYDNESRRDDFRIYVMSRGE